MRKLGIYGVIVGTAMGILIVILLSYLHYRNVSNLQKFGAMSMYVDLFASQLREMRYVIGALSAFSILNIILGLNLIRESRFAPASWLFAYGLFFMLTIVPIVSVGFHPDLCVVSAWMLLTIVVSFRMFGKDPVGGKRNNEG